MKFTAAVLALGLALVGARVSAGAVSSNDVTSATAPQPLMLNSAGMVSPPPRQAAPAFQGPKIPAPPRQYSRWKIPETQLPTNYVSATGLLFEQGLADPRGCDYRIIEVATGEVWGGAGGVVATHGWVLPGKPANRFAVCWNGLVYPVISVGPNADLEADVANLTTNGTVNWRPVVPESLAVATDSMLGIKGCLLLRLGRIDLATRYWQALAQRSQMFRTARYSPGVANFTAATSGEGQLPTGDPYLAWATEWAWALFDRTIGAHMRGDDALALVTIRRLHEAQPKIEAACGQRGFKPPSVSDASRRTGPQPYLDFLDQLPQLRADLERRAKEGERASVVESGLNHLPNHTERIAALIRDLDLVQARQSAQPGWVNLPADPIVAALIQEGDPAVNPLLDCLETDKRLTRAVGFARDFMPRRTVITVSNAANTALQSILQVRFSGGVTEMRAHWNKYRGMSLAERCYAMLQDDAARDRWLEAAALLTQPENVATFPGGLSVVKALPTNAPVQIRGAVLRTKSAPSVSELLARRALEVPESDPNSYDLARAGELGLRLAVWDVPAAAPVLATLSKRCGTVMKYSGASLGGLLTKLALARAQAGDPKAFEDYAAWLPTTAPESLGHSVLELLTPLERYPTNLVLQSVAVKIFADPNSAWSRLPWQKSGSANPAASGLFHVPAFRELLVRELDRKQVCGSVSWQPPSTVRYSMSNNWSGSLSYAFPEAAPPTNGSSAELRWCDWIALSLATGKHIAPYNPFAPLDQRDVVLEKTKSSLRQK